MDGCGSHSPEDHSTVDGMTRKRKRIANRVASGITGSPPEFIDGIVAVTGSMVFTCPSSTSTITHTITLCNCDGNMVFECDCLIIDSAKTNKCKHINTVLMSMFRKYIDNACEYDKFVEAYGGLNKCISDMSFE